MPPNIARPSAAFCSPPSDKPKDIGSNPMAIANAVINTGRRRTRPASRAASTADEPATRRSFANVTTKIELAVATPTLKTAPISDGTLNVVWVA
jgi:hypothetical protein